MAWTGAECNFVDLVDSIDQTSECIEDDQECSFAGLSSPEAIPPNVDHWVPSVGEDYLFDLIYLSII